MSVTGQRESFARNVSLLRQGYTKATTTKRLGGADVLHNLAALARDCVPDATLEQKAVAYALARLFDAVAGDRGERPVSIKEDAPLSDQVLSRAVVFLENPGNANDAVEIIAAIADIDRKLVP